MYQMVNLEWYHMSTVLVVDDKPTQTQLICLMLNQLGMDCLVAHSGVEAIETAKQHIPDLIIMDWIMPAKTLTGADAAQAILSDSETQHIPVIACSALDDMSQAQSIGCVDCLQKPFHMDILKHIVQQFVD